MAAAAILIGVGLLFMLAFAFVPTDLPPRR